MGGEREREGGGIEEREPRITHLIFRWKIFNRLLHHSTAVRLETKRNHVTLQMLAEFLNLVRVSKLEEFLDYIVTKQVTHQGRGTRYDFAKDDRHLILAGSLHHLLDES